MNARAAKAHGGRRKPRAASQEARILELTRTLQIIEEARAGLADQYDYAPVGFVTLDAKGCIREINLTTARMLGYERSLLVSKPFFTHVAKPSCAMFLKHLRECRDRQGEIITQVTLRSGRNRMLPVELRSVPVLDVRRGDTVYRTVITDITERLRTSQALRESEERHRDLVEHSPDGIFIEREGRIAFANRVAARLCGVKKAQELIGGELLAWVRPPFRQALSAALAGPSPQDDDTAPIEAQLLRRDRAMVEVEIVARCFRYEGEPAVLVVARDITQRKNAERHVLAISERERTTFGRDVHDSLCQSLLGAAFLAENLRKQMREISPAAAAQAAEIMRIVRESAEEARTLARGLCPVLMENSGLVAALHTLTADVTGRLRIGCTLECDDRLTISDANVATNLYRIAQEAVANAIRHGKAKSILIQLAAENGKLTLRVRDDGIGFPAKPKQTGMGLHTMRYRAATLGASLDVRRVRPRGAVVTCSLSINGEKP